MQQHDDKKLVKWLNKLQQESWQLELVVSGFAIFLMAGALDKLRDLRLDVNVTVMGMNQEGSLISIAYAVVIVCCFFVMVNLIIHVLLRGMWISTIGLRYVSGDIDFASLKLSPKFDRFLRRKIGNFDNYIFKLENICSLVFAFTFLIVFMLVGFALYILFLTVFFKFLNNLLENFLEKEIVGYIILSLLGIFLLAGFLYFLDFLSLGYLKRVKWFSKIYFPIYRFFSMLTFSSLYRPIYYNLVDNKFGRRVGILLVPYVSIVIFFMSGKVDGYVWYPETSNATLIRKDFYDDERSEKRLVSIGSIPSKFVDNGFLEFFTTYLPFNDDKVLAQLCPDFVLLKEVGFKSDITFSGNNNSADSSRIHAPDTMLLCMAKLYEVFIDDSLFADPGFKFMRHQNRNEYGLHAVLDVQYLSRGKHQVEVRKLNKKRIDSRDTAIMEPYLAIPFWKE